MSRSLNEDKTTETESSIISFQQYNFPPANCKIPSTEMLCYNNKKHTLHIKRYQCTKSDRSELANPSKHILYK